MCGKTVSVGHGFLVRNSVNKEGFDQSPQTHNFIAPQSSIYVYVTQGSQASETTSKSK